MASPQNMNIKTENMYCVKRATINKPNCENDCISFTCDNVLNVGITVDPEAIVCGTFLEWLFVSMHPLIGWRPFQGVFINKLGCRANLRRTTAGYTNRMAVPMFLFFFLVPVGSCPGASPGLQDGQIPEYFFPTVPKRHNLLTHAM